MKSRADLALNKTVTLLTLFLSNLSSACEQLVGHYQQEPNCLICDKTTGKFKVKEIENSNSTNSIPEQFELCV